MQKNVFSQFSEEKNKSNDHCNSHCNSHTPFLAVLYFLTTQVPSVCSKDTAVLYKDVWILPPFHILSERRDQNKKTDDPRSTPMLSNKISQSVTGLYHFRPSPCDVQITYSKWWPFVGRAAIIRKESLLPSAGFYHVMLQVSNHRGLPTTRIHRIMIRYLLHNDGIWFGSSSCGLIS